MALTFDVLTSDDANGAVVLAMVTGGWRSRWVPPAQSEQRYRALLEAVFTVIAVRYGSSPEYTTPEIVPDVRRAVRYVRLNAARLGVDPSRLGVFGGSAGGHLSLLLSGASDMGDPSAEDAVLRTGNRVAAVVPTFHRSTCGTDPANGNGRFPALSFEPSQAHSYSPIANVSADDPPTLLIHGDADELVPVSNSYDMYAALQEHGVTSKVIVIPDAGHGFRGDDAILASSAMVAWFTAHLGATPTN